MSPSAAVFARLLVALLVAHPCQAAGDTAASLLQRTATTEKLEAGPAKAFEALLTIAAHQEPKNEAAKEEPKAVGGNASLPAGNQPDPKAVAPKEAPKKEAPETEVNQTKEPKTEEPTTEMPKCVTRKDSRARAWWALTAKEGTPCVFGVDARDEGAHCVPEFKYGTAGWCYTKKDRTEWGSCSDGCPLYGPHGVIGKKLDGLAGQLGDLVGNLAKAAKPAAAEVKKEESEGNATEGNATESAAPNTTAKTVSNATTPPKAAVLAEKRKTATGAKAGKRQKRAAVLVQMDAAASLAQKAERQTELWAQVAEKTAEADDEDSWTLVHQALKKARAWQRVAGRAGSEFKALAEASSV